MAKILIVEDYTVTLHLLSYLLQIDGHVVVSAENGIQALDQLSQGRFDLLIVDIAMPKMDGLTLVRQMHADERYKSIPVIMLTASGEDRHRAEALESGVKGYLMKPISSVELSNTINTVLIK
ncbi:MAG: response regulator [Anaerolineae bacterium]